MLNKVVKVILFVSCSSFISLTMSLNGSGMFLMVWLMTILSLTLHKILVLHFHEIPICFIP